MKYVLILLLASCAFNVKAQSVRTPGQQKIDSLLAFNKRYYELEDHWVVNYKNLREYDRANFNKYYFGFVYFDEVLGYTFISGGRFGIDGKGHVFRDPADYSKSEAYKNHLTEISAMVSVIPDSILNQLNIKPIPDWVAAYHQEHPDKRTVAMKLHVGKLELFARDAAGYFGEQAEVYYNYSNCYKTEIRKAKGDSVLVLSYIGVADNPSADFIDIKKLNTKDKDDAEWLKRIEAAIGKPIKSTGNSDQQKDRDYFDSMTTGKIILFEGKPAIISNEIIILEPVG